MFDFFERGNLQSCPYGCCESNGLDGYLLDCLLSGKGSDVKIEAFNQVYHLHRLPLQRCKFFDNMLQWDNDDNKDNNNDKIFQFEAVYDNQRSFELCILYLYGTPLWHLQYEQPFEMIFMAQYLLIDEIVCTLTNFIINKMEMGNLSENLEYASKFNCGSASIRIIENGKGIMCTEGWQAGIEAWDNIPIDLICQVVTEDYFYVPNEWDRCMFIIMLIERRIDDENIEPLKKVLNENILYYNMSPAQLQILEELLDVNQNPYIDYQILHSALWKSVQLESKIKIADSNSKILIPTVNSIASPSKGLLKSEKWWSIPLHDKTFSGLPQSMKEFIENTNTFSNLKEWTKIPPFRFGITIENVSDLPVDSRVYSKTFWYAGSFWDVYFQKSYLDDRKMYQVGVYLHRANGIHKKDLKYLPPVITSKYLSTEPIISCITGFNNSRYNSKLTDLNIDKQNSHPNYSKKIKLNRISKEPSIYKNSNSRVSISSKNDLTMEMESITNEVQDLTIESSSNISNLLHIYNDYRKDIQVYFSMFTPARNNRPQITGFFSVADTFTKSQSWGWKSTNMCNFEPDGTFVDGEPKDLKFMIVLGEL